MQGLSPTFRRAPMAERAASIVLKIDPLDFRGMNDRYADYFENSVLATLANREYSMKENDYLGTIRKAGFRGVEIKRKKVIDLPDELVESYLDKHEIEQYRSGKFGLFSITVVGYKA